MGILVNMKFCKYISMGILFNMKFCKYISMGILFNMKFLETVVVIQTTLFGGTVNAIFNFSILWKLAIISLKMST